MAKVGDKFVFHSENGLDYDVYIINVNDFRPPDMKYGADVYDCNGTYAGDVMFLGEEFLAKCKKVEVD